MQIIDLVLHFLVAKKRLVFGFRHADRIKQMRIGSNMNRFHVRKRRKHHLHFGRLEDARILLHIAVGHFDIGLGKEPENLGEQIAFLCRHLVVPVLDVIGQRHLFRQPVDTLLHKPGIICPRITERFVDRIGFK